MPTRLLTAEMVVLKRTKSSSVNELPEGKQAITTSVAVSSKKLPSKNLQTMSKSWNSKKVKVRQCKESKILGSSTSWSIENELKSI